MYSITSVEKYRGEDDAWVDTVAGRTVLVTITILILLVCGVMLCCCIFYFLYIRKPTEKK